MGWQSFATAYYDVFPSCRRPQVVVGCVSSTKPACWHKDDRKHVRVFKDPDLDTLATDRKDDVVKTIFTSFFRAVVCEPTNTSLLTFTTVQSKRLGSGISAYRHFGLCSSAIIHSHIRPSTTRTVQTISSGIFRLKNVKNPSRTFVGNRLASSCSSLCATFASDGKVSFD